jgi:hypothetical protein
MMSRPIRSRLRLRLAGGFTVLLFTALLAASFAPDRVAPRTPEREASITLRSAGPTAATETPEGPDQGEAEASEAPAGATPIAYPVDLSALREKIPGNLYWQLGAPTEDEAVLSEREEEERRMNDLFGKVQSNTAAVDEIHGYYDRRQEISEDYIEFSRLVLKEYGPELPDSDRGLYALSIDMHRSRLQALPAQRADALARKGTHDRRRAEMQRRDGR